jgi:hypothetical protein
MSSITENNPRKRGCRKPMTTLTTLTTKKPWKLLSGTIKHVFSPRGVFFRNTPSARSKSTYVCNLGLSSVRTHPVDSKTTALQERIKQWGAKVISSLWKSPKNVLFSINKQGGSF